MHNGKKHGEPLQKDKTHRDVSNGMLQDDVPGLCCNRYSKRNLHYYILTSRSKHPSRSP